MIKFYVFAKRGSEKFFIFGPFLSKAEAAARLSDARGFDLDQCPETFREKIKPQPAPTVHYIGASDDDRPAWHGTGYRAAQQADLA